MPSSPNPLTLNISSRLAENVLLAPAQDAFSEDRLSFLAELSRELLNGREFRAHPDLVTFAFFIRPTNLRKYLSTHGPLSGYSKIGVGSALHISPGNIPINFAFSWLYGFIAGCSNLVRLPSKPSPQSDYFLDVFSRLIAKPKYKFFEESNYFFRSERGDPALENLLGKVDALIVWGGDETVDYFRNMKTRPDVRQLYFPSRQSSLIMSSHQVLTTLKSHFRDEFVKNAYNDTFLTDCNACSSPSKIFFIGSHMANEKASREFFAALEAFVLLQGRKPPIIQRMMDSLASHKHGGSDLVLESHGVAIKTLSPGSDERTGGRPLRFGVFAKYMLSSISEVSAELSDNEQTVLHWGLPERELETLMTDPLWRRSSASRLVPLGSALEIGFFWEGRDNPSALIKFVQKDFESKEIEVVDETQSEPS